MDTDKDGKADFTVFRRPTTPGTSRRAAAAFTFTTFGLANEDFMAPGDFDGDGKGDISVWRDTNGVWYRLNSSDNTFVAIGFGITGDEPVGRDYDGDGKTDLAVVRRTNGAMIWYVLRSSEADSSLISSVSQPTTRLPATMTATANSTSRSSVRVQRRPIRQLSTSSNQRQRTSIVIDWGLSNDLVVPGDYDGDGKTDIAVVREGATPTSNLVWYVRRSSDGGLFATQLRAHRF